MNPDAWAMDLYSRSSVSQNGMMHFGIMQEVVGRLAWDFLARDALTIIFLYFGQSFKWKDF